MQLFILDSSLEDIKTEAKDAEGANLRIREPTVKFSQVRL